MGIAVHIINYIQMELEMQNEQYGGNGMYMYQFISSCISNTSGVANIFQWGGGGEGKVRDQSEIVEIFESCISAH